MLLVFLRTDSESSTHPFQLIILKVLSWHPVLECSHTYISRRDLDMENFKNGSLELGLRVSNILDVPRNSANMAKLIQDRYKQYFNNEGAVPWQEQMI